MKIQLHDSAITALALSEGDKYYISGSNEGHVSIVDIRDNKVVRKFKNNSARVNAIQMSPDCKYVAMGCKDGSMRLWDFTIDKEISYFEPAKKSINCLAFNPRTLTMASGSSDGIVRYWDLDGEYAKINQTKPDSSPVTHIGFRQEN